MMGEWLSTAISSDKQRILGVFGEDDSWGLMYNLYADVLLKTDLVPNSVRMCRPYHIMPLTSH